MAPIARKHTRFGLDRFNEALTQAVVALDQFKQSEAARIRRFVHLEVTDQEAESVLLRCFERGVLSARLLPEAIRTWRQPAYPDFQSRTWWSLENCLTGVLAGVQTSNPQRFCALSLQMQGLLAEATGLRPETGPAALPA